MGDRCYLELTMRRVDLARFAPLVDAHPDKKWWDDECGHDTPELVKVQVYEANYAWYEERMAAAQAGIPFYGTHSDGGSYSAYDFVALDGEMLEAQINHEGYMVIALDHNLQPIDDIEDLRAYVAKREAVKKLFGSEVKDAEPSDDQQAERPAVPAGLRGA